MVSMWVYKENGTVQCHPEIDSVSLQEMRQELASLAGAANILNEEERIVPLMIPAVCGAMTGQVNAYELNETGAYRLFRGFMGPQGFKPWIWGEAGGIRLLGTDGGGGDPFPVADLLGSEDIEQRAKAFLNVISTATQTGSQPGTVSELIGRRCRTYKQGDPLTLDYRPDRVNIELDDRHIIQRIWFG